MALTFTESLMEAKRRAQLQGRPLSSQETSGIVEGWAASASDRTFRKESLDTQKSQFAEQLVFEKQKNADQLRLAEKQMRLEKKQATGALVGAGIGAGAGFYFGGPPGAVVGSVVGSMLGKAVGGGCIIISVCTSSDSPEVEIAREFRDRYLDETTLTGYYTLCIFVVPLIKKYPIFRRLVKRIIVDRLIDYGRSKLSDCPRRLKTSRAISKGFLALCRFIGKGVNSVLEVQHA